MTEHVETYKKYRPTTLDEVVGQPQAVKVLREFFDKKKTPHSVLLSGPTGTGKTTLARIIKGELKCADGDFHEINAATDRGIDTIREIIRFMPQAPIGGPCKIWYLDECHQLSSRQGGDAQTSMLKMLEDTPKHVYFLLATSHPEHLLPTVRNRCTELKLKAITEDDLRKLVNSVLAREKLKFSNDAVTMIVECSQGSARRALTFVDAVRHLPDDERADAIQRSDVAAQAIDLCRQLLNPKSAWSNVVRVLNTLDDDPETVRRAVLGYATKVLLSGGKTSDRAFAIIVAFEGNFHDSGRSGLIRACYEVYRND